MELNLATMLSVCTTGMSLAATVLAAYLARRPATQHFRYAAVATMAAAVYCGTNAALAGDLSAPVTAWAARVSGLAVGVHGAAWLAALASWDRRPLSGFERAMMVGSVVAGAACLVPDVIVRSSVTTRALGWIHVTYREPELSPAGLLAATLCYVTHVVAAVKALGMRRRNPRAKSVATGLGVYCVVIPLDFLSAVHVLNLPYLADAAVAFVLLSTGSVVVREAAENAETAAELARERVAFAERENLAALGQLAAVMAHEVRNPVAIIFGALTNLRRVPRGEDDVKLLGIIDEEADRLQQLVTRLLDAVRPFEIQYSSRPVRDVIRLAVSQVTTSRGGHDTEVSLVGVPNEEVECDEILLVQAIANLVQNALVANGRRSPVRVHATVEEPSRPVMLRIEIADDGDGVPSEARPHLFAPFFTTRASGTGLGLALVRRIAGAHGGTVEHVPLVERGATFVLRVPLRARDAVPRRLIGNEFR